MNHCASESLVKNTKLQHELASTACLQPQFRRTTKAVKMWQTVRSFDSPPPVRVISFFTGSTGTLIHNMRESAKRMPHAARFTPSDPPETCSAWRHATIFKHAVIGITHVHATPPPPALLSYRCCESQPHPAKLSGESDYAGTGKPTHHEYWKGFFSMQRACLPGLSRDLECAEKRPRLCWWSS